MKWIIGRQCYLVLPALIAVSIAYADSANRSRWEARVPQQATTHLMTPIALPATVGGSAIVRPLSCGNTGDNAPAQDQQTNLATQSIACQTEPSWLSVGREPCSWGVLSIPADHESEGIRIESRSQPPAPSDVAYKCRYAESQLHITTPDGDPVLSYWHGKPKPEWKYPLTSFISPLKGLDGEDLVEFMPDDHLHHRGIFWAWVRTQMEDREIGGWWVPKDFTLEPGEIHHITGPVFAGFSAKHNWVHQPKSEEPGVPFVEEHVICRVFKTTEAGRAIDLEITLTALKDGVRIGGQTFKDKGYGGLTIRFPKHRPKVQVCADGKQLDGPRNQLPARWVDWTGMLLGPDGKILPHRSGATLMVHKSHPPLPEAPPKWITRFYGPINPAYPGVEMLEIPQNKPLTLRYRILIHRGTAETAQIAEHYAAYNADWNWEPVAKCQ